MIKLKGKAVSKVVSFWSEDRSLTTMLLLLLLFIFVFVPMSHGRAGGAFIKIAYTVMLLTGILSVAKRKRQVIFLSILALVGSIVNWVSDAEPSPLVFIIHDIAAILFNTSFALIILVKTFAPGDITFHRIVGSVVVFLLVGLIFSYMFHVVYLFTDHSSFNNLNGDGLREFLYFSFTTLTTMGYGDITPVHPIARSLANFEALIGQLYPAILIARLVSMEFESSIKKRERN
jgi:hypothetical protein